MGAAARMDGDGVTESVDTRRSGGVECDALVNSPAPLTRPGPGNGGDSSDAGKTLLTADALAYAAQIRAAAMKDKSYRIAFVGGEVGRFMRAFRWADRTQNSLDTYEIVLARLSLDFAHYMDINQFSTEDVRDFLDEHWGEASPATRRNRLAIVKSFFRFCVEERGLGVNPAERIKPPKKANVERQAYSPSVIEQLRAAQPTMREQIAVQLLGLLGLRKNELRLLQVKDFDLGKGTFIVHGKGQKVVVADIAIQSLKDDLNLELLTREPDEYLLYPRERTTDPMDPASLHRWFKNALKRAGLSESIKIHELRHSAADNLYRETGNVVLAQQLLRHESIATTQGYLHPAREDLAAALASLHKERHS
jgi:integrase/recombinase XerD